MPKASSQAVVIGTAVLAMTVGACSGRPEPGAPAGAATVVQTSIIAPGLGRPADLPLDDVLPCELVTDAMRLQFAIDRPDAVNASGAGAPSCTFISSTVGRYVVAAVHDKGVDALGRPATAAVSGYRAVEIRKLELPSVCHLGIDVVDGQRLDIEIQRRDRSTPQDQICRDTMAFAEAVLAVLRQKLGR